jgi:hypothetical protein
MIQYKGVLYPGLLWALWGFLLFFAGAELCAGLSLYASEEPEELKELLSLEQKDGDNTIEPGAPRDKAQFEAAWRSSIQAGTKKRYEEIIKTHIDPIAGNLEALFDFERLAVKKGDLYLMPPVITEAGRALRLREKKEAKGQEKSFLILRKAELSPELPSWRQYLYLELKSPDEIHPAVLPSSSREKSLWKERILKGWDMGVSEAEELFRIRLRELVRDYKGMILYLELQKDRLISPPVLHLSGSPKETRDEELIFMITDYDLREGGTFLIKEEENQGKAKGKAKGKGKTKAKGKDQGKNPGEAP